MFFFSPYHIFGNVKFNQSKSSLWHSPNIEFLNTGSGFIVTESDPGAINKGISEIQYRGIILNMI